MYETKTFSIPELTGISAKNIEEHLGLYAGYVKNTNAILESLKRADDSDYARAEMQRRFSFEYNGMKNHEYYFGALEGGAKELSTDVALHQKITEQWGSFNVWLDTFKKLSKTRGVGWAILYYDRDADLLLNVWIDEQHLGHLNSAQYIVGIDMWEHAFVADYQPSGKGQYIEDYLSNLNWEKPADLFAEASA
jgi:Fe-Mn family superoxide dismutase